MSLSSLRKTYGKGSRREVVNRAIRAEIPGGNALMNSLNAVHGRLHGMKLDDPNRQSVEARLAELVAQRDGMAAQIEAKHQIGENTNRSAPRWQKVEAE